MNSGVDAFEEEVVKRIHRSDSDIRVVAKHRLHRKERAKHQKA